MTKNMLDRLKVRIGVDVSDHSQDDILRILLEDAEEYILAYTRRRKKQWLKEFNAVRFQIATINYGRLGAEGVQSKREGDISTVFSDKADYPDSIVKTLNPYRIIKGLPGEVT